MRRWCCLDRCLMELSSLPGRTSDSRITVSGGGHCLMSQRIGQRAALARVADTAKDPTGGNWRHFWLPLPLFFRIAARAGGRSQPDELPVAFIDRASFSALPD